MKECFSYVRFSSSKQSDKHGGSSLHRQSPIAERVAKEQGWTYRPEWNSTSLGVSAYHGDNVKTIKAIIKARLENKIPQGTVLILEALDRATRLKLSESQKLINEVLESGLEIYTDTNKRHLTAKSLDNLGDIITTAVELDAAHQYAKRLSDRSNGGINKGLSVIAKGEKHYFGGFMPSYIKGIENGKWLIDQDRLDVVKRIFREYQSGKSINQIAVGLNTDAMAGKVVAGLKRTHDLPKNWSRATVRCVLVNPCVTGNWKLKGVEYPNYLPVVIPAKEYAVIEAKLRHNTTRRGGSFSQNVNNVFRGLCFCKYCKGPVGVVSANRYESGNHYSYFGCLNGVRHKSCKATHKMSMATIEKTFFDYCLGLAPSQFLTNDTQNGMKEIEEIQAQLAAVERRAEKIKVLLSDDKTHISEVSALAALVKQQRTELEAQLKTVKAKTDVQHTLPKQVRDFTKLLNADLSKQETRKQLVNVLPSIVKRMNFDFGIPYPYFDVEFTNGEVWSYTGSVTKITDDGFTHKKAKIKL